VPAVLLAAPINATWAANHIPYWREKGFSGFLLTGIQDSLESDVWAVDGDPATKGNEDLLLREVRLAVERLVEGGINRDFAVAPLAPEAAYFSDPALAGKAVGCFAQIGAFCKLAGLRGVAIDTRTESLFYDYRWDGYRYDSYTVADVEQGARDFGRRMVRAVIREFPESEILAIADGYTHWSPLWTALIEGMIEALDPAGPSTLHLLTRESCLETAPAALVTIADRSQRVLRDRFSDKARVCWRKKGALSLGVSPLGYWDAPEGPGPIVSYPLEAYRVQLAMAKLLSDRYVWVDGGGSSWWRVTESDAATYGPLFQNGAAIRTQTRPVVGDLDAYTVRTPFDDCVRVGPYTWLDSPCAVLRSDKGAAVVLWQGSAHAAAMENRQDPVPVTDLRNGRRTEMKPTEDRVVLGPFSDPVLIETLPIRRWIPPASAWFEFAEPPSPGVLSVPVRFGFANRTEFALSGSMEVLAPKGFSVKPSHLPFDLKPGEAVRTDGAIRGKFPLGASFTMDLAVLTGGRTPVTCSFPWAVCPDSAWRAWLDGPVVPGIGVGNLGPKGSWAVAVCTQAGEVACLSAAGGVLWTRRFPGRLETPPALGVQGFNGPFVAAVDPHGLLRTFTSEGRLNWEKPLGAPCSPFGLICANLDDFPGDEILLALTDGRIVALHSDGEVRWSVTGPPGPSYVTSVPASDGYARLYVARAGESPEVESINREGQIMWRATLENRPVVPPVLADTNTDGAPELLTAENNGVVRVWDIRTGSPVSRFALNLNVAAFTRADLRPEEGPEFLAADGSTLFCYSRTFDLLWSLDAHVVGTPIIDHPADGPKILVSTREGTLLCLDGKGAETWRDTRSPAPLVTAPMAADLAADGRRYYLVGGADRTLRAVAVGRSIGPP
jgi:hypothetical protein